MERLDLQSEEANATLKQLERRPRVEASNGMDHSRRRKNASARGLTTLTEQVTDLDTFIYSLEDCLLGGITTINELLEALILKTSQQQQQNAHLTTFQTPSTTVPSPAPYFTPMPMESAMLRDTDTRPPESSTGQTGLPTSLDPSPLRSTGLATSGEDRASLPTQSKELSALSLSAPFTIQASEFWSSPFFPSPSGGPPPLAPPTLNEARAEREGRALTPISEEETCKWEAGVTIDKMGDLKLETADSDF